MTGFFSARELVALLPVMILAAGGLVLLLCEAFGVSGRRGYQSVLTVLFALGGAAAALALPAEGAGARPEAAMFAGQAIADGFSIFVTVTVCGSLALSALVGAGWLRERRVERGEFYALALFGASGMALLGMASDLLLAFLGIEVMSLATYCLTAYQRRGKKPSEAAFKYFLLGAFSSALLLYGAALAYGASGSTLFASFGSVTPGEPLLLVGLLLVVVGLAFKVAAVPFHAWVPDVYEGAPAPVTAFMAAGVKTAAFAVLARLMLAARDAPEPARSRIFEVVGVLALATMFFGNLLALTQRSVKRMLAYSSIAHAGYLLVAIMVTGLIGGRPAGHSSLLYYLASYSVAVIGAFGVVAALEGRGRSPDDEPTDAWDLSRFAGLGRRSPPMALAMAVFMVSLAGIPPTAGFIGKLFIFGAAMQSPTLYVFVVVGLLTSALGAYYYLRVVVYMYMRSPAAAEEPARFAPATLVAIAVAAVLVLALGIGPQPIANLAQRAAAVAAVAR